jgi:hypothetical protein
MEHEGSKIFKSPNSHVVSLKATNTEVTMLNAFESLYIVQ